MDAALESRTRELAEALRRVEPASWRRPPLALSRRRMPRAFMSRKILAIERRFAAV